VLDHSSETQRRRARKYWGRKTRSQRFWDKVDKSSDHWIWIGAQNGNGYGIFYFRGRNQCAHRVSLILSGVRIPKGFEALHKCDIKLCVKPDCLFIGTQMDNIHDMISKGRQAIGLKLNHPPQDGENNHNAKLTYSRVCEIKKLLSSGARQCEIMKAFGVSRANVWAIAHGKSWSFAKE